MTEQPPFHSKRSNTTIDRKVFPSVALTNGPTDVLEFLLPLWAGAALSATPAQTGWLVAAVSGAAVLTRPVAARLVDRGGPLPWAALGSMLFAVSLLGYALTETLWVAFLAAFVCGAGNAFFWIAVRSWASTSSPSAMSSYGRLLHHEGQGALVAYVLCFALLGQTGYSFVFTLGALSCLAGAVLLLSASSHKGEPSVPSETRAETTPGQTFPFLVLCAVTAAVESGVALVLLIHLQQSLGFTVYEVAYVLAPGFIAFVLVPTKAASVTRNMGVTRAITLTLAMSAALGWTLMFSPPAVLIAVVWTAYCACLGVVIPTEQAVVAHASGQRVGKGMSRYENSQLLGVALGSAAFGLLYSANGLAVSGLVAGVVLATCALGTPYLLRKLPQELLGEVAREGIEKQGGDRGTSRTEKPNHPSPGPVFRKNSTREKMKDYAHARKTRVNWFQHLGLFTVGQALLWFFDLSALAEYLTGEGASGTHHFLVTLGRLWLIVFAVDTVWSWYFTFFPREVRSEQSG